MKIAYVLNVFPLISERWLVNEISELMENDHEIRVIALERSKDKVFHKGVSSKNLLSKTHFFREFSFHSLLTRKIFYTLLFFLKLIREDFTGFLFNPRGRIRPNLRIAYSCAFIPDCDIIHAHFATESATLAMELSKILDKPFTFTVHAYDIFKKKNIEDELLPEKLAYADKIISISEYNKKYLLERFNLPPEKIEVIYLGAKPERYKSLKKKGSVNHIITISRLVEKKGLLTLIEAFSLLDEWKIDFHSTIIGEGPLKSELSTSIKKHGLSQKVSLIGSVIDEKVDPLLASASIFVLPCIKAKDGDMDGIPVVLMEAMSSGLPVVSTNISGIPELVEDGVAGYLVPPNNPTELAKAIKRLLDNPPLRTKMGEKGAEKIVHEFNVKTNVKRLMNLWEEICL